MGKQATRIAIINAGTATLKTAVLEARDNHIVTLKSGVHEWIPEDRESVARSAIASLQKDVDAIGHRFVHGGTRFVQSVRIDDSVQPALQELNGLAPLHNPAANTCIEIARECFSDIPQFVLFDTAFHAGRAAATEHYAVPMDIVEQYSIRRFGFHGLAHAALIDSAAEYQGIPASAVDAVSLQLGAGVSACAVRRGKSIETTMGFSPLDGLVMATRCGSLDPAIVTRLVRSGLHPDTVEQMLNNDSGLQGLCGHADMREILLAESAGDARASLALELFTHRIIMAVGAYLTLLDGHGALVFGGGIGTHSHEVRSRVAAGLSAWDVRLDPEKNMANLSGAINAAGHRDVFVFPTHEHHRALVYGIADFRDFTGSPRILEYHTVYPIRGVKAKAAQNHRDQSLDRHEIPLLLSIFRFPIRQNREKR